MISLIDIGVSYAGKAVINGLSMTIAGGERIALTGPSGSGKTTVLNLIAGLTRPQTGKISVSGSVSYVFQEPRLLPWCNALENLNVVMSDSQSTLPQAYEMLRRLGLADAEKKYPHELSGGMQQRLSIGRSLCYGGDILLLDEPLKGMDKALRDDIAALINEKTIGKTLVLASHDSTEIDIFADKVFAYHDRKFEREASV